MRARFLSQRKGISAPHPHYLKLSERSDLLRTVEIWSFLGKLLFELVVSLKRVPSPLNASSFTAFEVPFLYGWRILKVLDL